MPRGPGLKVPRRRSRHAVRRAAAPDRRHAVGDDMLKVIFACVHNAGRSQMAAAFFNQLADSRRAQAISAGTEPGERVHPEVLEVMREAGIDLSEAKPRKLTVEL